MKQAVEIRKDDRGAIDEIIIHGSVHIEQMTPDGWFMGVEGEDGSYWQFWFGSKNGRAAVDIRHTEHLTPEENARLKQYSKSIDDNGSGVSHD